MTVEEFVAADAARKAEEAAGLAATMGHVRQKPRARRGNKFYRDKGERKAETLCGAEITLADWTLAEVKAKKNQKAADDAGLCPECRRIVSSTA